MSDLQQFKNKLKSEKQAKDNKNLMVGLIVAVVVIVIVVIAFSGGSDTPGSGPEPSGGTGAKTITAWQEKCLNPWNGEPDTLIAAIKTQLKDPGSFDGHETRGNWQLQDYDEDDVAEEVFVLIDYSAKNSFGGNVRQTGRGWLDWNCNVLWFEAT